MRALDHSIENLYRPHVVPPMKALCYQSLRDLFEYLPKSKADPQNIEYRQKLQLASWMSLSPTKFERHTAIGLSHSLGHMLGATYGIPHGITSVSISFIEIGFSDHDVAGNIPVPYPRPSGAPQGQYRVTRG